MLRQRLGLDQLAPTETNTPTAYPSVSIPLAIALMLGLSCAHGFDLKAEWYVGTMAGSLLLAAVLLIYSRGRERFFRIETWLILLFCLAAAAVGGLRYEMVDGYYPGNHIVRYARSESTLASVRGRIVSPPELYDQRNALTRFRPWHHPTTAFRLECHEALTLDGWRPISGRARVYLDGADLQYQMGQMVEVDAILRLSRGPGNPGQYDPTLNHRARRETASLFVAHHEGIRPWPEMPTQLSRLDRIRLWRHQAQQRAQRWLRGPRSKKPTRLDPARAFLLALLLGQRQDVPAELNEAFTRSGAQHFLSLSGLHVGIFSAFAWGLATLLRLPIRWRAVLALAALAGYLFIVPARPPVLRAGLICAILCIGYALRKTPGSLHSLAWAAIIILLWRPFDLFAAGFQLSFAIVLGIVGFAPPICRMHPREVWDFLCRRHCPIKLSLLPDPLEPCPWYEWLWRQAAQRSWELVVVSIVAWVVSLPLIAHHFQRVSVWTPVSACVLSPLIFICLQFGFLAGLLALILPPLGTWLQGPLLLLAQLCIKANSLFADWPGNGLVTGIVPAWWLAAMIAVLLALLVSRYRWRWLLRPGLVALLLVLAVFFVLRPFRPDRPEPGQWCAHFLDVGHGLAIVIETDTQETLLFDAGSLSSENISQSIIAPFLRHRGLTRITHLVASHEHIDHIGGVLDVCNDVPVDHVWLNQTLAAPVARHSLEGYMLQGLQDRDIDRQYLAAGEQLSQMNDFLTLTALWPEKGLDPKEWNTNDRSLVLRINSPTGSCLLTADIGSATMKHLLATNRAALAADVMLWPHHGHRTEPITEFIQAVGPDITVVSCSRKGPEFAAELHSLAPQTKLYLTHQHGCVTVRFIETGIEARTFR